MNKLISNQLTLDSFLHQDGIYFPPEDEKLKNNKQKQTWEKIGQTYYDSQKIDTVADSSPLAEDYTLLAGRPGGIWNKFPLNKTVDSILEIGCGYGRIPLHLSKAKKLQCQKYYGIDISENLLRRLIKVKKQYDFFPDSEFYLICDSAENLPLADDSIDIVLSNCVFMHIANQQLKNLLSEIARVLKPGGIFVFNHSFHNQYCPAHVIHNLVRRLNLWDKNPIYLKQYTASEINQMLNHAGIKIKCPNYIVEPTTEYAILPEIIKGIKIPFARAINRNLKPSNAMKATLAYGYSAYNLPVE